MTRRNEVVASDDHSGWCRTTPPARFVTLSGERRTKIFVFSRTAQNFVRNTSRRVSYEFIQFHCETTSMTPASCSIHLSAHLFFIFWQKKMMTIKIKPSTVPKKKHNFRLCRQCMIHILYIHTYIHMKLFHVTEHLCHRYDFNFYSGAARQLIGCFPDITRGNSAVPLQHSERPVSLSWHSAAQGDTLTICAVVGTADVSGGIWSVCPGNLRPVLLCFCLHISCALATRTCSYKAVLLGRT